MFYFSEPCDSLYENFKHFKLNGNSIAVIIDDMSLMQYSKLPGITGLAFLQPVPNWTFLNWATVLELSHRMSN